MERLVKYLSSFARDTRANMAIMMAVAFPLLIVLAALAVDAAALYHQKRVLQAGVDMAALHAMGNPDTAFERAALSLTESGHINGSVALETLSGAVGGPLDVITGIYWPDPDRPVATRFEPAAGHANAVRVDMRTKGNLYFAQTFLTSLPDVSASAVAAMEPRAAFSIGSRLVNLNAGIANAILGGLLGTTLSLQLVDYENLANLDIALLGFLDALAGQVGLQAGTYGQLLDSNIALADIAAALSVAAQGQSGAAADVLLNLAGLVDDSIFVGMTRLIVAEGLANVGVGTAVAGLDATVNALELLTVAAMVADGDRQAGLDLGVSLPSIAGVTAQLAVGQPPQGGWYTLGPRGAYVRTAQVRVKLDIRVLGHGGTGIGLLEIGLPVYLELASGEAQLTGLRCPPSHPGHWQATIAARPGIARLGVGAISSGGFSNMSQPLSFSRTPIVNVASLARVTARADVAMAATAPQNLTFTQADVIAGTVKTVSTTTPVSSLTASLIGNLDLKLELLGTNLLGGLLSGLLGTVQAILNPVAPVIDTTLNTLLSMLGIGLGEADIRVHGFECRHPVLVQ